MKEFEKYDLDKTGRLTRDQIRLMLQDDAQITQRISRVILDDDQEDTADDEAIDDILNKYDFEAKDELDYGGE